MSDGSSREQLVRNPWFAAFRIAAIYAVIGALWILFSDELVGILVADRALSTRVSILKGWIYVVATGFMLYGLVLKSLLVVHDSENSLRESENQLRLFVNHTPAAVAMLDREMRYMVVSRRWLADYRLGDRNVIGISYYEVSPETAEKWREIHRRCLAGVVERAEEDPFVRPDGSIDWLRWEVRPWWTAGGEVGGIIMFTELITEQKLAREELARNEERLGFILESVPSGVSMIDRDGRVTFINAAAERILGVRREEIVGAPLNAHPWRILTLDGKDVPSHDFPAFQTIRSGAPVSSFECVIERTDHTSVMVSMNSAPILDSSRRVTAVVTSISDITERKRAERERLEREEHDRVVQDEADEAKRQFYRGTIYSITEGKLNLVTYDEVDRLIDANEKEIHIGSAEDLAALRDAVEIRCKAAAMNTDRMQSLVIAVGEAAANAVKHAGGGIATIGERDGRMQVAIRDHGPGMDALILPRATLMRGFSTKPSLGLGYMLILESVDTVYLATDRQGTLILMEKIVKEPAQDATIERLLDRMPDVW